MTHRIIIDQRGFIRCIHNPKLPIHELGVVTKRRVSTITPMFAPKKQAFRFLRWLFGEDGKAAAWTRTWKGPWLCRILKTGEWSVFERRESAIEWEIERLRGDTEKWL